MHTTASKRVLTQSSELGMHVITKEHLVFFQPVCHAAKSLVFWTDCSIEFMLN